MQLLYFKTMMDMFSLLTDGAVLPPYKMMSIVHKWHPLRTMYAYYNGRWWISIQRGLVVISV